MAPYSSASAPLPSTAANFLLTSPSARDSSSALRSHAKKRRQTTSASSSSWCSFSVISSSKSWLSSCRDSSWLVRVDGVSICSSHKRPDVTHFTYCARSTSLTGRPNISAHCAAYESKVNPSATLQTDWNRRLGENWENFTYTNMLFSLEN